MARWRAEISHSGLNKYRVITGSDKHVVDQKANAQIALWDEMWQKRVERDRVATERLQRYRSKESAISDALARTQEAEHAFEDLDNILSHTLTKNDSIDWELLKDNSVFLEKEPVLAALAIVPDPPNKESFSYKPKLGLFDAIIHSKKESRIKEAQQRYDRDFYEWQRKKLEAEAQNKEAIKQHADNSERWKREQTLFYEKQRESNDAIAKKKIEYLASELEAIVEYCDLVLSRSEYPDYFPQEFAIDYNPLNKILIVEYVLPSIDFLPKVKEVKYIQARNEFKEILHPESTINKLYDSLIYQIALRTIHELF